MRRRTLLAIMLLALGGSAEAAEVVAARAVRGGGGWTFSVTVRSADTGWERYADGWEITAPDGARLGFRALLHPHVDEQPFTRSLAGVAVPKGVTEVRVRAHDSVEGWGPALDLTLPTAP